MATILGRLVNAVLDPILTFALDLKLVGAALASVAARVVIAVMALQLILKHYGGFRRPTMPGMAIVGRLSPLAFGVIFSLSGAVGPILGQNFGARDYKRVRAGLQAAVIFTALVILLVSALLFALRVPIAALFDAQGVTRDLVYLFCGPLSLLFFFNGVLFVANATFNNLGHPFYSTFLNWGRNTVGLMPLVLLGAGMMGAQGVLIGQALAGVIFGLLAWWLARRVIARAPEEIARTGWLSEFGRQGRLMSLLHLRR